MKSCVEIFSQLGEELKVLPQRIIAEAERQNEWFCQVPTAIEAIREQMLDTDKIHEWITAYPLAAHAPKRVAIIMAGNIPAVGFADLMYTICSGNIPVVKYSSKDRVLMEHIVKTLQVIEPQLVIEQHTDNSRVDAVIATGSDTAALHFRAMFGNIPTLIRGSRHSVAVLSGNESCAELEGLSKDIFTYSGLGCRNVSLIFAPQGFDFQLVVPQMPQGYNNNYRHARALMTMQGVIFNDCNGALTVEGGAEFPRHISCINICRYNSLSSVKEWIAENRERLQCVVSSDKSIANAVAFGRAQYPALNNYADDIDVMKFLLSL
jgi:hypothetical protein